MEGRNVLSILGGLLPWGKGGIGGLGIRLLFGCPFIRSGSCCSCCNVGGCCRGTCLGCGWAAPFIIFPADDVLSTCS